MRRILISAILTGAASLSLGQLHPYFDKSYPPGEPYVGETGGVIRVGVNGIIHYARASFKSAVNTDLIIMRLTPTGQVIWQRVFNGAANAEETVSDVQVDRAGNTYVAGSVKTASAGFDWMVLKYNANGDLIWSKIMGTSKDDKAARILLDPAGTPFVGGLYSALDNASPQGRIQTLTKLRASDGFMHWHVPMTYHPNEFAGNNYGQAIDFAGNSYLKSRYWLYKISPHGQFLWDRESPAFGVATDEGGVYIPGLLGDKDAWNPGATVTKLNFDGNVLWSTQIPLAPGENIARFHGIARNAMGGVVALGTGGGPNISSSSLLSRVLPGGSIMWRTRFPAPDAETLDSLRVTTAGDTYVNQFVGAGRTEHELYQFNAFGEIEASADTFSGLPSFDASPSGSVVLANGQRIQKLFRGLVSMWFNPAVIKSGGQTLGMVRLSEPVLEPYTLQLMGDTSLLTFPASVTVPAGSTGNVFNVLAKPVSQNSVGWITGFRNQGSGQIRSNTVTIQKPLLRTFERDGEGGFTFQDETSYNMYVELDAPAGPGMVAELSTNSSVLVVPATVAFTVGQTRAPFELKVGKVTQQTQREIICKVDGVVRQRTATILP